MTLIVSAVIVNPGYCLQLSFHFLIEIFQRWFKTLDRFHDSSISEEAKQTGFLPPNVIQMTKYSCWSAGQKIAIVTHSTTLLLYFSSIKTKSKTSLALFYDEILLNSLDVQVRVSGPFQN